MFAILKNNRGTPVALFAIERETTKRFYGKLHDTLEQGNWFYLTGYTNGGRTSTSYVTKEIVMCLINSDNAWHMMKPELVRVEASYTARRKLIRDEYTKARISTCEQEEANERRAAAGALEEIHKYVSRTDLF